MANNAASARKESRGLGLAALALGLAVVVRAAYLYAQADAPSFSHPEVDAAYHDYWARAMVSGDWTPPPGRPDPEIRQRAYFRPPGYPFFLAAVYRVLGADYLHPRLVQAALGLLNVWLAFVAARRWFGPLAGGLAAVFMALYAGFVYFEAELLEPVLLVTLSLGILLALGPGRESRPRVRAVAAGVLLGLYALVRPNGLLFAPAAIGWMAWRALRAGTPRAWRAPALAFLAGLGAAVAPAAVRNLRAAGDAVLISSNAGINLYIGNHPQAEGVVLFTLPGLGVFGTSFDYPAIARAVEKRAGHPLKDSEVSRYFTGEAFRFIRGDPARFLRGLARKALLFWGPVEMGHNKEDYYELKRGPVLRWLPGSFALALALGGMGVLALRRGGAYPGAAREAAALMGLYVAAVFVSHLPFFVAGRYRLPVVPFLLILGAAGVAAAVEAWRAGRRGVALRTCLVGLAVLVPASINWAGYRPSEAKWRYEQFIALKAAGRTAEADAAFAKLAAAEPGFLHALHHQIGTGLADAGRFEEARDYLADALRFKPGVPDTLASLGSVLYQLGRVEEARSYFAEALRIEPAHRSARLNLAALQAGEGRTEEAIVQYRDLLAAAPDDPEVLGPLATALERAGHREEALAYQERAVRAAPGDALGHSSLGALYGELGRPAEALREFEMARRLEPGHWPAWFGAGVVFARQGAWDECIRMMTQAARLRPEDRQPFFYMAGALARLNRVDEALAHYQEALGAYSNYVPWLAEAAWMLATHPLSREPQIAEARRFAGTAALLTDYRDARVLDAFSAALARGGQFGEAAARAEEGAALAAEAGRTNLAAALRNRAALYKKEKAYLE